MSASTTPETSCTPRAIEFEGARNFRDLGGYTSRFGGATRWGCVFRAGALDRMTATDLARYASLGIVTAVDLRNADERDRNPDPIESVHVPIMNRFLRSRARPDFSALVEHDHGVTFMRDMNRGLLEHAGREIGEVLRIVADHAPQPVMFHCTAGKDRTGLIAALLLELLGVDRETVLDDFELTDRFAGPKEDSHGFQRMLQRGVAPEAAAGAFGAPRSMMGDVLDHLERHYGGAERYVLEHAGLDEDVLDTLRTSLLG